MNHFLELQRDQDNNVWVMIHSGSRNLGKKVADHYNKLAMEINEKWYSQVPKEWELAFLPLDSTEGKMYMAEMEYCLRFASANRYTMMSKVMSILNKVSKADHVNESIEIHHNYAIMEHHFGHNVMVHRKGATRARKDELGIIPGSQGSKSYIVRGLGNPESFHSCSHGAGRKMGRNEARRSLNLAEQKKILDDLGVIHGIRHENDLDEAPGAYKQIELVMANQMDLVTPIVTLEPIAVIKGD